MTDVIRHYICAVNDLCLYVWQNVPSTWRNTGVNIDIDDLMSTKKPSTASSPMKQMPSASGKFWQFVVIKVLCSFHLCVSFCHTVAMSFPSLRWVNRFDCHQRWGFHWFWPIAYP